MLSTTIFKVTDEWLIWIFKLFFKQLWKYFQSDLLVIKSKKYSLIKYYSQNFIKLIEHYSCTGIISVDFILSRSKKFIIFAWFQINTDKQSQKSRNFGVYCKFLHKLKLLLLFSLFKKNNLIVNYFLYDTCYLEHHWLL